LGESIVNLFSIFIFGHEIELAGFCFLQGFMLQFFQMTEFLWITIISFNLFTAVYLRKVLFNKMEILYHIICWGFSTICAILPLFTVSYGVAGIWCWIIRSGAGSVWRFIVFYIPLYLFILLVLIMYAIVVAVIIENKRKVKKLKKSGEDKTKKLIARLFLYPIIFLLLYIMPTVNRIQNWVSTTDILALYILQALTAPLLGFCNSLVYGLNSDTKKQFSDYLEEHGCISAKKQEGEEPQKVVKGNRETTVDNTEDSIDLTMPKLPPKEN